VGAEVQRVRLVTLQDILQFSRLPYFGMLRRTVCCKFTEVLEKPVSVLRIAFFCSEDRGNRFLPNCMAPQPVVLEYTVTAMRTLTLAF
jgi:hypothetical protein